MKEGALREYGAPLFLAIVIGMLAGLGAVVFKQLIYFFQFILWPTGASFLAQYQQAPIWYRFLVPVGVGLLLGPIITYVAPEIRGPGVPEVMESLALRGGYIRRRVTAIKTMVTALFIASGASLGREGPIVQIGASIGSSVTQLFGLGPDSRRLAIACGAAAGIGATFQAPMAGTMFAVEILLFDLEVTSLSNIVIAAVMGTATARYLGGSGQIFAIPEFVMNNPQELFIYFFLGIAAGLLGLLLMGILFRLPGLWKALRVPDWLTPALGGFVLAVIGLFAPEVLSVGYESINLVLTGELGLQVVLLLLVAKIIATGFSIGSGMSGGIFAPSLFMGAMLGALIGLGAASLWPELGIHAAGYALIGMGAMVSATTLAPMTAILTIFELTLNYDIILPLMVSCIAGLLVVRVLHGYSVYETKLLLKGVNLVKGHEVNILRGLQVSDHMDREVQQLTEKDAFANVLEIMAHSSFPHFVVLNEYERLVGILTLRDCRGIFAHPERYANIATVGDLMQHDVITVCESCDMETAFHMFARHQFASMPVVDSIDPSRVVGQLKRSDLLAAYDQYILKENTLSPSGWACPLPNRSKK